ncbi:hypothetical protein NZD89_28020 (plasmid) [Alicyclobacillus fastidiosus]|uniref:Uncharacterized protein n=1 Tax=Alicyclobacillus fastidiosus TaxID=392011 RepID=A0ABY6ZPX6_9BACL|nr:hypothetical protein [Alicyclobacillus fastidiosus]WAH44897.1 hypothetical protein NZD89_28020 [Alicyclobacillus fastidiosus]GMA65656.1 hypothetical protein GCM10025859_60960 [Alicyclobacillus fastidiosus]
MKWVMMAIFLVIVQFTAHETVMNTNNQEFAYQRIVDAMQFATQDAVEQVEPTSVANGEPIFDTEAADAVFRGDLAKNLQLDPITLSPQPNTILKDTPVILKEQFIDWSNATFPYNYTDPSGFNVTLTEPSIVYEVQFTIPSLTSNVQPFTITIPVVQSYDGD